MANPTSKQMSPASGEPHWGRWLRGMIRAAGYKDFTHFRRTVGCGRRQVHTWLARADAPQHSPFAAALAATLGITVDALLVDWHGIRPTPAPPDVRAAVLRQLAADAAHLDLPALYQVATLAALLAQYAQDDTTTKHVGGSPARKQGEGAGPMVPGVQETGQQSRFHPAPADTLARAFSSGVGANAPDSAGRAASPRRALFLSASPAPAMPGDAV